ncbi:hypothetical protein Gotur_032317 [Gossypium turneri]
MIGCLLCDMVTKDGMWNVKLFRAWFPKDIDKRVVSIPLTTLRLVLLKLIGCAPRKFDALYIDEDVRMETCFATARAEICGYLMVLALFREKGTRMCRYTWIAWNSLKLCRNKVAERLAKVASDRNTEVQVFVIFPEEMLDNGSSKSVMLSFSYFSSIFSLSSLPTSAIIPKANVSLPVPSSQLVENLCNGKAVENHRFCLKALSTPEVIAAMDTTQLGTLIMKLGAANSKATLNVYNEIIKKPGSPQALKALNCYVEAYKYAILSFEMVSSELVEEPQTENYDVAVIGPEISNCEKELINAKVQAPRLLVGNRFMKYYVSMGYEITSSLELENPNEFRKKDNGIFIDNNV